MKNKVIDKLTNNPNIPYLVMMFIMVMLIVSMILYYLFLGPNALRECSSLNGAYSSSAISIKSLNSNDPHCQYSLKDYYIYSAYNCCSVGSFKNNYVDICALKQILKLGVRGLDFEVYSIGDQPVVATSTCDSYYVKETYNSIPFSQIMETIQHYAFSNGTAPNPNDPIIMHLRIKSTNNTMYSNLAKLFKHYDALFLGPKYSYENNGQNLGNVKVLELSKKIILIVDKMNNSFLDNRDFYEYVNMTSNSVFMYALPFTKVKNTPDIKELQEYNKLNMTIVLPDGGSTPPNPNPVTCLETGCQMTAMMFQTYDINLVYMMKMFNQKGYAFALKPENLRYIPTTIPAPTPQNPALSYQPRQVSSNYYSFVI